MFGLEQILMLHLKAILLDLLITLVILILFLNQFRKNIVKLCKSNY